MDPSQNTGAAIGGSNGTINEDSKENLNQVINSIQKTLGLLHQLHLTVSSFTPASQHHLLHRINSLVSELDSMAKLSEKCNIQVPMEVLNLIDDGKNPDEFTRDVLNSCIARNQVTKGKTDAFKDLRKHILEELEQTFPDEVDMYREIRASSAAEAKRLAQSQSVLPNGDAKVKSELFVLKKEAYLKMNGPGSSVRKPYSDPSGDAESDGGFCPEELELQRFN